MSDGQSAIAEPISMQEALAQANSRIDAIAAKGAAPEEAPQEAEDEEDLEMAEAEAEADDTDETDEPEDESDGSEQVLTVEEYGDVLIDLNGTPTPLAEVLKGTLRQADYSRKTMAHAEKVKADTAELEARKRELDAREKQLNALETENPEPDWEKLAEEDPLGFPLAKAKWDKQQKAKEERLAERRAREKAEQQEVVKTTVAKAVEIFPEWRDAANFDKGAEARRQTAMNMGFTAEEYGSLYDFRLAALLEKAARYDAMQNEHGQKRALADKKLSKAPKVLKPGASKGATEPAQEKRAAFLKRLSKPVSSTDIVKGLGLR